MDNNFVMEIANTIREQLVHSTQMNVLFSWGISKMVATEFNGMASLVLYVNGRLHKGRVIIAYNEGIDYYEIYLLDNKGDVKKIAEDVDFTQLGDIIDTAIEKGDNEDEYVAFVMQERNKLMTGQM